MTASVGIVTTSLRLANSVIPTWESSRPWPDSLTPPKGRFGSEEVGWLIQTMPVSSWSATARARSRSLPNTAEPRPNGDALASATAWASSSTR